MDYSKYHPDWKDVIRPSVLKRDAYKCRHCSIRHKSIVYRDSKGNYVECDDFIYEWAKLNGYKPYKLFLAVAHVNHDKTDNRLENLLSLCPKCHSKFDKDHKRFVRKLYNPSDSKIKAGDRVKNPTMKDVFQKGLTEKIQEMTAILLQKEQEKELYKMLNSKFGKHFE